MREPSPLGYVIIQVDADGKNPELCAHGPDSVEADFAALDRTMLERRGHHGERYLLCKLVPIPSEVDDYECEHEYRVVSTRKGSSDVVVGCTKCTATMTAPLLDQLGRPRSKEVTDERS